MKKMLISLTLAFLASGLLEGCVVSEKKLTDKVQEAIVNAEAAEGKQIVVTEFDLGDKQGKNYKGVLKGTVDGKEVVYDVVVADEGSDFDVDWNERK
jgi:hypothetical protein